MRQSKRPFAAVAGLIFSDGRQPSCCRCYRALGVVHTGNRDGDDVGCSAEGRRAAVVVVFAKPPAEPDVWSHAR